MNISLDQLRYFKTVVDERSFSRASLKLKIGQPTLSKAITKIEEEQGLTLIQRTTRSLTLTSDGRRFYEKVAEILESISKLSGAGEARVARSCFGLPDNIALHLLPKIQKHFGKKGERFDYVVGTALDNQMKVIRGEIQGALFFNPGSFRELHYQELAKIEFVIVTSIDSKFRSLHDLESGTYVGSFQTDYRRSYVGKELLAALGVTPTVCMSTNLQQLQIELAKTPGRYTIVPRFAVQKELRAKELKEISTPKKVFSPLFYGRLKDATKDDFTEEWLHSLCSCI